MRIWNTYLAESREPVLVPDGGSFWAFLLGPVWLAANGALIAAALALAAELAAGFLLQGATRLTVEIGIAVLLGLSGRDLVCWQLGLRGYRLAHIVAARDHEAALIRLLAARPDLAGRFG